MLHFVCEFVEASQTQQRNNMGIGEASQIEQRNNMGIESFRVCSQKGIAMPIFVICFARRAGWSTRCSRRSTDSCCLSCLQQNLQKKNVERVCLFVCLFVCLTRTQYCLILFVSILSLSGGFCWQGGCRRCCYIETPGMQSQLLRPRGSFTKLRYLAGAMTSTNYLVMMYTVYILNYTLWTYMDHILYYTVFFCHYI